MATKYLNLSTDSTFSENSDYLIPSQKAIKTAVDAKQNKITTGEGLSLSEDGQLINTVLDKTVLASNYVNPTLWKGTLAEYEALGTYDDNITYIITDDTDLEDMINDDVVSTSSTYSSLKINELLSNDSTNIQGGEYIDVIKPKGETLYEYDVLDLVLTQYGISSCNNIVLNTNVFDYVGVSMLDFISISPTHSNDLYGSQLPESFIPYLIPATKKDGTQYTVEEILTQEYIDMLNGTYETPFETFAEMIDYASYSNAESTALVYIVKFEQEGASFLIAVYPDKNGNYIWLAGGMYDITPINTIELESSDKSITIDWNKKALSMFENLSVDESNLVHKTENEEIAGVKTFKDSINFIGGDFQQDVLNNVLQYNAPNGATFVNTLVSNVSGETDIDGDGTAEKIALGIVYQGMSNYTSSQELMSTIVPRQGVTPTTGYMIIEGEGSVFACGASAKDSITSKMFGLDETSGAKITQVSTGLIEASANSKFADGSIDSNAHLHIDAQLNQIDMSITNNLNSKTTGINLKDGVMTFTADSFVGLPEIPEQVSKVSELENDSNYLTSHQDISGKANTSLNNLTEAGNTYIDNRIANAIANQLNIQLNAVYPVGSLYFCTQSTCPMASLISGSTWEKVGSSLITSVNTNVPIAGNGMTLGLTNGSTNVGAGITSGASSISVYESTYGSNVGTERGSGLTGNTSLGVTTDATKSGIVGTVTRSALTVNIFKRTA